MSEANSRVEEEPRYAPRQALLDLPAPLPLPGRIRVALFRGFAFARPRLKLWLRARAEITSHFAAGPQARWRGANDELYPGRYVRSEQQSQRACGPQPVGARRRAGICFVAAPRRCPTSPSSRRLASARPALAPKCTPYFLTGPKLPVPFQGARAYLGKYVGAFMKSCAE